MFEAQQKSSYSKNLSDHCSLSSWISIWFIDLLLIVARYMLVGVSFCTSFLVSSPCFVVANFKLTKERIDLQLFFYFPLNYSYAYENHKKNIKSLFLLLEFTFYSFIHKKEYLTTKIPKNAKIISHKMKCERQLSRHPKLKQFLVSKKHETQLMLKTFINNYIMGWTRKITPHYHNKFQNHVNSIVIMCSSAHKKSITNHGIIFQQDNKDDTSQWQFITCIVPHNQGKMCQCYHSTQSTHWYASF